ncbi:hypothetical protein C2S52_019086 [Perilla frutescens var. hirtella]|nr:hypothetical protein C2S52_019086 [Perilla frutescens var. hirtella]
MSSENRKRKRRAPAATKHQDRISQLPDDILIDIISLLSLPEATATSILSTRWRYLSTYITHLTFPPFKPNINHVLDSHKGGTLKEIRVHAYNLEGANIEKWFKFALAKEVEIIDIHMKHVTYYSNAYSGHYSLQQANFNLMGQALNFLKELSLSSIDVNGDEIKLLLSKFPSLESLSIARSKTLRNISIVGSKLKHLDISSTRDIELIEIDNVVNLVSLRFYKMIVGFRLILNNVPKLIKFSMCDSVVGTCARILSRMPSSILDQLRTLKILTNQYCTDDYKRMLPQLTGIKSLQLEHFLSNNDTAYSFEPSYLIQACPSLERVEIKFLCWRASKIKVKEDENMVMSLEYWPKKLCPNLKTMKISGFIGSSTELKFALSILNKVKTLEELVVEACDANKKIRKLAIDRAHRHFGLSACNLIAI